MTIKELNKRLGTFEKYKIEEHHEYKEMIRIAKVEGLDLYFDKNGNFRIRNTKKNRKKEDILKRIGKRQTATKLIKTHGGLKKLKQEIEIQSFIDEYQVENAYMLDDEELKEFGKKIKDGAKNNYDNTKEMVEDVRELKKKLDKISIVNAYK